METATMMSTTPSLPPSIMGEEKATESAIDAYATKVLETMSPPETTSFIDDNLGPYVTSLLRCADIQDKDQVTTLAEFDSLLELLEDQCNMDKKKASDCVLLIADAVVTQVLPFSERTITRQQRTRSNSCGLYTQGGGLDSFRSSMNMKSHSHLPESITAAASAMTAAAAAATFNAGGPSPIKPDNLIPIDLMGELDDPSPNYYSTSPSTSALHIQMQMQMHRQQHYPKKQTQTQTQTKHRDIYAHEAKQSSQNNASSSHQSQNKNINDDFPPLGSSPEAFPPLGASSEKPKKVKIGSSKKSSHGKTQQHSDKNLAATLFRPARPRQNSIESEDAASSHQQRSRGSSNASASMTMTSTIDEGGVGACSNSNNIYFQQQLHSCVEILLSMNQELSEEAASAAGLMANTDFNIAQHVVDSAMTAPPICRHMLHEGCYRSDCTFSHDVDGHTCLFWLRGRCGKGNSCKFFHGFHEKLLKGIDIDTSQYHAQQQSNHGNTQSNMAPSSGYHQYTPHTSSPSASASSSMVGGFGTFSPLLSSSWQTPSLLEGASTGPGKPNNSSTAAAAAETPFSFANIASKGYEKNKFSEAVSSPSISTKSSGVTTIPTVRIPQDLWNPHENRDSSVFHINDPLERYQQVAASVQRSDVIDLHFQSIKTFPIILEKKLPLKLSSEMKVWIVTGTGHHVGTKTHQKGGGALELAVIQWLVDENYNFSRGKDRNGLGGAILVNR